MDEEFERQLRALADASEILIERAFADDADGLIDSRRAEKIRTAVHALYIEGVGICIEQGVDLTDGLRASKPADLLRAFDADARALALAKAHWSKERPPRSPVMHEKVGCNMTKLETIVDRMELNPDSVPWPEWRDPVETAIRLWEKIEREWNDPKRWEAPFPDFGVGFDPVDLGDVEYDLGAFDFDIGFDPVDLTPTGVDDEPGATGRGKGRWRKPTPSGRTGRRSLRARSRGKPT